MDFARAVVSVAAIVTRRPPSNRLRAYDFTMSNEMRRMIATIAAVIAMSCVPGLARAGERKTLRIAEGIYAVSSGTEIADEAPRRRTNVAFVVGRHGVAVIDTGISYHDGVDILAAIRRVTPRPVRLAIVSHPGQAAIFGAAAFQERGIPVLMHRDAAALVASRCDTCLRDLRSALGDAAMRGTRVVVADRLIDGDLTLDVIGRRLRVIAPPWSSAPGALAVFDESTSTLITGSMISIKSVPDMRDGDPRGWREALATLAATRCRHLVASHGAPGHCSDIAPFAGYLTQLEARVAALLREGVGLAELDGRCELPGYAGWDGYQALHRANAERVYLRLERALFDAQ
jgi:glyoxylase-like metal-dependent hydrolase (beta-lactamase superfamily II)